MVDSVLDPISSRLRRPPQITLALDSETHVLYVNRDLAGTGFAGLSDDPNTNFHQLIHPGCDGKCRFNTLLKKAWSSMKAKQLSIEWEIDDPILVCRLRLNLSRPPTSKDIKVDRRRRYALLTVTDVTEIRREYHLILANNRELLHRVSNLESEIAQNNDDSPADRSDATGNLATNPGLLGELSSRIIAAQEHERKRIAADLHDGVAQTLGVVKYGIETRIAKLQQDYPEIDVADFDCVIERIREAVDDLRKISRNLSPSMLDEFGICAAVDMLCNEFAAEIAGLSIDCKIRVDELMLPDVIKVAIYRVVQEALNNARKHAAAERIKVGIVGDDQGVTLTVEDNGVGFAVRDVALASKHTRGLGLGSMRERVEASGGVFEVQSKPGQGTTLCAFWPQSALQLLSNQTVLNSV